MRSAGTQSKAGEMMSYGSLWKTDRFTCIALRIAPGHDIVPAREFLVGARTNNLGFRGMFAVNRPPVPPLPTRMPEADSTCTRQGLRKGLQLVRNNGQRPIGIQ